MKIIIKRNYLDKQTQGLGEVYNVDKCIFTFKNLERPWLNNAKNTSCIPEGEYIITKEIQDARGKVLRVHNVKGRVGVLMHVGNYVSHSKGCLLCGDNLIDINDDGLKDVTNSRSTMNAIYDLLPDGEENILLIKS